uniref:Carbohydrate sulfotransferase n=1 Tax=Geotrypetes seraphini TaxID=260995 RepID=A0A6P8RBA4_GEOSA|nr:carbohydrate sulfotransferase 8 [Geotrypetes seraphini]
MRLTYIFSFILLFGAAMLVLFIHLQNPAELDQQQIPGFNIGLKTPKKDGTSSNQDGNMMEKAADKLLKINQMGSTYPLHRLPVMTSGRRQSNIRFLITDNEKKRIKMNPIRPYKQRKRFLIKKNPILIAMNSSIVSFSRLKDDGRNGSWKRLYEIQRIRKKLMQDVCSKYKKSSRIISPYHVSRIFVEDKHRLLYCEVPKVGCSNWKRVLMILNGLASSAKEIEHNTVHFGNHLKTLDDFDQKGIYHRLKTYTKMLFVREPFERLVSAFRDKLKNTNKYYHSVFGKAIISKYRRNATREALSTGTGVQFKEFIQYLLDVHKPVGMDIHWDLVSRLCSPCLIDYDFIGKFETMEEDANFLFHLIAAPHNLTFPQFKDRHSNEARTTTSIAQQYFAQLSSSERQRTYDFYYMDYLMFNYSKPFEDLY